MNVLLKLKDSNPPMVCRLHEDMLHYVIVDTPTQRKRIIPKVYIVSIGRTEPSWR